MFRNMLVVCVICSPLVVEAIQQGQICSKRQWQCRDGSCISFNDKCDGIVHCADGSDEIHAFCRNTPCQDNLFRCAYGACVDSTAPCNGVQDCADSSDELQHRCHNATRIQRGKFLCDDGSRIPITDLCDGQAHCSDASDETVGACTGSYCASYLFQCAYGACVDQGADCDEKQDCFDNSDESDELCNRSSSAPLPHLTMQPGNRFSSADCELPPYPANGRYTVRDTPTARPGERLTAANITVTCNAGYAVDGTDYVTCINGAGFEKIPKCVRYCVLNQHVSVNYTCVKGHNATSLQWPCKKREFPGTTVKPTCNMNYRSGPRRPPDMVCQKNGSWDHVATCIPECGKITPHGTPNVIHGRTARYGELPWHTGIYIKTDKTYQQICGGNLATTTAVITAAHCFDTTAKNFSELYAVALGKVYRSWDHEHDNTRAQKSNVSAIHMPPQYHGSQNHYQSDIAILILETKIILQFFIRPVCIDFEKPLSELRTHEMGKIAGWGLTSANGVPSQLLQAVELPYVPYSQCFAESPSEFKKYLSNGKFCAGYLNGTSALCEGDSGGGLAFPEMQDDVQRYYLRGIVSTAHYNNTKCNPYARTVFTSIMKHQSLIKKYIDFNDV